MSTKTTDVAQAIEEKDTLSKAAKRAMNPSHAGDLLKRGAICLKERGFEALCREISYRISLTSKDGAPWKHRADIPLKKELRAQKKKTFAKMPMFSVVVPLYNTPVKFLREMVKSVLNQSYKNFELVLIDASGPEHANVSEAVKRMGDNRIKYTRLVKNEGIASNTNIGLCEAEGDYFVLLDHDDVISPSALYELAKAINETGADFLYSDEVVLSEDMKKLEKYHFKPDFAPDYLRGVNYITHLSCFSKQLLEKAGGGERSEFDGAQDYDLILRLTEQAQCIHHIPKVLYYWRYHSNSTAKDIAVKPYAIEAGANALRAHLKRMNLQANVTPSKEFVGSYKVEYALVANPLVSVIIPNKDHVEDLKRCIASVVKKGGYTNLEIIIVENNSTTPEIMEFYKTLVQRVPNVKILRYVGEFNYSAINNLGVKNASGEHLLLLNNDVEFLSEGFIKEMLSYSQRPDVGAVGAKLFYPDNTVQHAGVFMGLGGSAGHSHKGHSGDDAGDMFRLSTTQNMCAVTGACLMVKKELYIKMGGLDEKNFAVAYNDVDFCLKLYKNGLVNVFTPFAKAYHYESKSRGDDTNCGGEKQRRYESEKARFVEKYADIMKNGDPYYNPHLTLKYENYGYR